MQHISKGNKALPKTEGYENYENKLPIRVTLQLSKVLAEHQ
jgi:hypothetical protein